MEVGAALGDSPRGGRPLYRNESFVRLWFGQSVSLVGSQVTTLALPLVAALTLHASAWQLGVLAACRGAPNLVLGLPAGVWVDRLPRRRVFVVSACAQACTLAVIPVAALAGFLSIPVLVAVTSVTGAVAVFGDISGLALVPMVVPRGQLTGSQGAIETGQSIGQIAGPALGGWLVQALGAPVAIVADAASFVVAAIMVWRIRITDQRVDSGVRQPVLGQIVDGARSVFGQRILRAVTLCTATHILFYSCGTAVLVLYLSRDLRLSPAGIGAALAAGAVGGLTGSVLAGRLAARFGMGRTMAVAIVGTGVASMLVPGASFVRLPAIGVVAVAQALMWCALQVYNVLQVPVRYAMTPESMHGRVNATVRTTVWGTAPLGALLGGLGGSVLGLPVTLLIGGVGAGCAALWLVGAGVTGVHDLHRAPDPVGRCAESA